MPLPAISNRRHAVFRLYMRPSMHNIILKICEHNILQTACRNFAKFTT